MKKIKWPVTKEQSAYMKMRQNQNRILCKNNPNENRMLEKLEKTSLKWTRQARWGYRLFDFWNSAIGVAIEVDGPEHNPVIDHYWDEYIFRRSAIVVLRVKNMDEDSANNVLDILGLFGTWDERRAFLGVGVKDVTRKALLRLPEKPSLLDKYLKEEIESRKLSLYVWN